MIFDNSCDFLEMPVLNGGVSVSHLEAISKTEEEGAKYHEQVDVEAAEVEAKYLETVKPVQRDLQEEGK